MSTTKQPAPWAPCYAGLRHHLPQLKAEGRSLVYLALLTRLNAATGQLNPTIATLAADTGLYDDTVTNALKWLIERGLVARSGRRFKSNSYSIPVVYIDGSTDGHRPGFQPGRELPGTGDKRGIVPVGNRDVVPVSNRDKVESIEEESREEESRRATSPPAGGFAAVPAGGQGTSSAREGTGAEGRERVDQASALPAHCGSPAAPAASSARKRAGAKRGGKREAGKVVAAPPSPGLVAAGSSWVSLVGYLGYGEAGASIAPDGWRALEPTSWNYFHRALLAGDDQAVDAIDGDASELHVAVYAALVLCGLREDRGLPIDVPTPEILLGGGKKKGVLGDLYAQWGAARTIEHVRAVRDNLDAVLGSFEGWSWKPALDFGFIRHGAVVKAAQRLAEYESTFGPANDAENWAVYA